MPHIEPKGSILHSNIAGCVNDKGLFIRVAFVLGVNRNLIGVVKFNAEVFAHGLCDAGIWLRGVNGTPVICDGTRSFRPRRTANVGTRG